MPKLKWAENKGAWIAWLPGVDASSLMVTQSASDFYWCTGLDEGRAPTLEGAKVAAEGSIARALRSILLVLEGGEVTTNAEV
jgi:hypothetical protein